MALRSLALLGATAAVAVSRAAAYALVDATTIANSRTPQLKLAAAAVVAAGPVASVSASPATAAATDAAAVDMQDGCIHFQIIHSTNTEHFSKRAVELTLANRSDVAYYAKLDFGTPSQPQYVQLDTGSFELWINPTCAGLSTADASFCNAIGSFDPADSSTFASLGTSKQLRYGIGSANISYVTDDISLPGTSSVLKQVQFGVASATTDEFSGILGIGYGQGLTTRYPNFVDELALQNVTRLKAFSLALGSKSEQEGVIVFGGVDTSKFAGKLARLPITPAKFSPDGVPRYWVNMSSMALTTATTTATTTTSGTAAAKTYANSTLQVFLDSGSTLTLLPTGLADSIAADFGVTDGPSASGFYMVDCDLASSPGSLDFAFAGVTVHVPFSELIRQSGSQCMLGLQASSDFVLLGDTFLRSAYVVIDQTDNVVWMAQYTNCGSTPAALVSAASLSTLSGACAQTGNVDTASGASGASESSGSSEASPAASGSSSSASSSPAAASKAATTTTQTSSSSSTTRTSQSNAASSAASPRNTGIGGLYGALATSLTVAFLGIWL